MESSMNLSDVYVFKKVASTLSFTKAARQIGVSRSAVSKQVSRLEHDLGAMLLNRTTRSVCLTEAGRTFDAHTAMVDSTIERAADLVRGADSSPLGTVSFTLPSGLGAKLMPPLTTEFQERWPELRLNVQFDDRSLDMVAGDLDLAIRISRKLADSSLISRRLASTSKVVAASPRYLRKNGVPQDPSELNKHRCLGLGSAVKTSATWKLQGADKSIDVPTTFALSTNSNLALILAACLDSGIIYIPKICIAAELANNQLQVIPGCVDSESYGVYALYPHRKAAAKVKVLVDFIEHMLPALASLGYRTPSSERITNLSNTECTDGHAQDRIHVA